jgi:hypothetical protein
MRRLNKYPPVEDVSTLIHRATQVEYSTHTLYCMLFTVLILYTVLYLYCTPHLCTVYCTLHCTLPRTPYTLYSLYNTFAIRHTDTLLYSYSTLHSYSTLYSLYTVLPLHTALTLPLLYSLYLYCTHYSDACEARRTNFPQRRTPSLGAGTGTGRTSRRRAAHASPRDGRYSLYCTVYSVSTVLPLLMPPLAWQVLMLCTVYSTLYSYSALYSTLYSTLYSHSLHSILRTVLPFYTVLPLYTHTHCTRTPTLYWYARSRTARTSSRDAPSRDGGWPPGAGTGRYYASTV